MISTTKASEERERRDQGDMRQKNKCKGVVLVGSLQKKITNPGQSPQTEI